MSPAPTEETHAAIQLPTDVWEFIGWAIKGLITFCLGWIVVLVRDVRSLKTWRSTQSALAEVRDQQRGEILTCVKCIEEKLTEALQEIAHLKGVNEGKDR